MEQLDDDLVPSRQAKLRAALADAPFDAFIAASGANVAYATGYRSVAADLSAGHPLRAVATPERSVLVAPCADAGPAIEGGLAADDFVPYGRFYFTSARGHAASEMADRWPDAEAALGEALSRTGLTDARLGIDESAAGAALRATLARVASAAEVFDASAWALGVRAAKLPAELRRLRIAAHLAEDGVDAALAVARAGLTEREIAAVVAGTMVAGGGMPRFVVVTAGERSALADAHCTDKTWAPRELLRFDIGCTFDGYWSDIGRTAVLGEPDELQASRYAALLAGEDAELALVRPGVEARAVFDAAIATVEAHGLAPYRRQHCGHGIGSEVYEPPIVNPAHDTPLVEGMTFCLETPFYELGWGGMMVEDTVVITPDGHERFTRTDRSLRVIAP